MTGRIVVGIDGSADADRALRWALDEAHRRGDVVEVVHAWTMPGVATDLLLPVDASPYAAAAHGVLDGAVERCGAGDVVDRRLTMGAPGPALVEASRGADLLVLGERGHGALLHALVGSVCRYATSHARCPVVVLPHRCVLPRRAVAEA